MAVFALKQGRLVAPSNGVQVTEEVAAEVLGALRAQLIDLVETPLFAVGWSADESLIALDSTGQIVTLDVLPALDSAGLMEALARSGQHSELTRAELARLYTGGEHRFGPEWEKFVDATPPQPSRGPRLYLFVLDLADDAVSPIRALRGAGVETHQILAHQGEHGLLVEVANVAVMQASPLLNSARRPIDEVLPSAPMEEAGEEEPIHEDPAPEEALETGVEEDAAVEAEPATAGEAEVEDESETGETTDGAEVTPAEALPVPEPADSAWNITGWNVPPAGFAEPAAFRKMVEQAQRFQAEYESSQVQPESAPEPAHRDDVDEVIEAEAAELEAAEAEEKRRAESAIWLAKLMEERRGKESPRRQAQRRTGRVRDRRNPKLVALDEIIPPVPETAEQELEEPLLAAQPTPEIERIFGEYGELYLVIKRRRVEDESAKLTERGIVLSDGTVFADPTEAAQNVTGSPRADGWRVWRLADGRRLGDLR